MQHLSKPLPVVLEFGSRQLWMRGAEGGDSAWRLFALIFVMFLHMDVLLVFLLLLL